MLLDSRCVMLPKILVWQVEGSKVKFGLKSTFQQSTGYCFIKFFWFCAWYKTLTNKCFLTFKACSFSYIRTFCYLVYCRKIAFYRGFIATLVLVKFSSHSFYSFIPVQFLLLCSCFSNWAFENLSQVQVSWKGFFLNAFLVGTYLLHIFLTTLTLNLGLYIFVCRYFYMW